MKKRKIEEKDIYNYIFPELDILQAFLSQLHLKQSLQTLLFLRQLVEIELSKMNKTGMI